MEGQELPVYNSDSGGEEQVDIDGLSDEMNIEGGVNGAGGNRLGWINWFCALEGHEFLVEIDEDFIRDPFNIYGLQTAFPNSNKQKFKNSIKLILSPMAPSEEDLADEHFLELNQEASDLYGLVHCRYIHSPRGLAKVYQKYLAGTFGFCPRALCDKQKVLPVGLSDTLKTSRFKVFCPRCEEVYLPKFRQINIDGSYFGTALPHIFLKHYPNAIILPPKVFLYEPKIFGFNVYGKRGSKFFEEPKGTIKYIEDSLQQLEKEKIYAQIKEANSLKQIIEEHKENPNADLGSGKQQQEQQQKKKNKGESSGFEEVKRGRQKQRNNK